MSQGNTRPFNIVKVKQEDLHGCVIACVAMVTGITYEQARAKFHPRRKSFPHDCMKLMKSTDEAMAVIKKLGFNCEHLNGIKKYKRPAIAFFDWPPPDSRRHAMVWDPYRQCFHDPACDDDQMLSSKQYMKIWRRSGYGSIIVTGMK